MKYIVIDTNIWVRIVSQGKPGCEIAHFEELLTVIEESKLTLLLPEVIHLELGKNWRTFKQQVEIEIEKIEKELDSLLRKPFWTEIEDVLRSLRGFLAEQKAKKIGAAQERYQNVQRLLTSPRTVVLPFTSEMSFRGRKRLMAGKMPKAENRAHSDACILETLAEFFSRDGQKDEHELCFCSENVAEFGLATKERHILHPLHKDDLPAATEYCISLEQVITFFRSEQKVVAPSPTMIEEALHQQTKDEVEAQFEMEEKGKGETICAEPNCYAERYLFSRYCTAHHDSHLRRLSSAQQKGYKMKLAAVLDTLPYKGREIIKLRWGITDGYSYTPAECGRIFEISPQQVGRIEAKAIRRLQHPVRRRLLNSILP